MLDVDPAKVVEKGRLQPGPHVPGRHRRRAASSATTRSRPSSPPPTPTSEWLDDNLVDLDDLPRRDHELAPAPHRRAAPAGVRLHDRGAQDPHRARWPAPASSRSARWAPTRPSPCCRTGPRLLFDYFTQLFAQVTNPPLDAIREELVTAIGGTIGPEGNLLDPRPESCRQISLPRPILNNDELAKLVTSTATTTCADFRPSPSRACSRSPRAATACGRRSTTCGARRQRGHRRRRQHPRPLRPPLDRRPGARSRRCCSPARCTTTSSARRPAPRSGSSSRRGEAREVHHMCLLLGYGAAAINPYLAFETIEDLIAEDMHRRCTDPVKAVSNYIKAVRQGRAEGHVQDGHLAPSPPTPAPRSSRPSASATTSSTSTSPAPSAASAASASTSSPTRCACATPLAYPSRPEERAHRDARGRRRVPVAPRGRVPPLQPRDGLQAPARHPHQALRRLQGVHRSSSTTRPRSWPRCAACSGSRPATAPPIPIDEVEPVERDRQALLAPAPCPTARSRPRPTRRWPSP